MVDELSLKSKVSVITGAASGIGRSIAETFAFHGSEIALVDINEDKGGKISANIKKTCNIDCMFYNCDVSKYENVNITCQKIIERFDKVDNLVCCAGYLNAMPANQISIDVWEKSISINLNGVFYFVRSLINPMLEKGRGNIIIIASSATINGSVSIDYAAAKSALHGIAKNLSYELLPKGIRANIITPAVIDTPMLRVRYPDDEETNRKLNAQIPLGRIGKPKDIANTALFLASDMSEYICGQEIIADGGRLFYSHPSRRPSR